MTDPHKKQPYFRAEKTSRNRDDYRVLLAGTIVAVLILFVNLGIVRLNEARWFRDLTHLTPFYNVVLTYSRVNADTIEVGGILTKRRCVFRSMIGYVTGTDGIRRRVLVDPTPEVLATGTNKSRPPSSDAESWGPWLIRNTWDIEPVSFEIFIDHEQCPTDPKNQTNQFVEGQWVTFQLKKED